MKKGFGGIGCMPLFTVIIPTKNRAQYLYHTLRTCSMQEYENFEVIVSDDSSTDNTRDVVEDMQRADSRIKYISHGSPLGMRENFECALNEVKSGYVIALGGDDGLLPEGISNMHEILCDTGMDILSWPAPVYSYPNVSTVNGQLMIYRNKGQKIIDSQVFLERQVRNMHYLSDLESPMFYVKGVVSTKLIEKVRSRSVDGRFYLSSTPDGYSGIVLAGEVSKYAFSGRPFSIYGLSSGSQGLGFLTSDKKGQKHSEGFYKDSLSVPMHHELSSQPYSPLITLMTVDFLLTARDLSGWPGKIPTINYRKVIRNSIAELANGLYGEDRIGRELKILYNIAKKHGLDDYMSDTLSKSKRYKNRSFYEGSGFNGKSFFFDGNLLGINNIYDAAYATNIIYQLFSSVEYKNIYGMLCNSLRYRISSRRKGESFPSKDNYVDN